ncbi:hypothetical protein Slin15195_G119590 [Septoria linicola]|uniref:Uncharacterized protein n=1 Tax=Septoria linicola TaxID=215465 RepID=A0A9Q9B0X8_9PEZI|nr:hypothetical protein Slin14017_G096580 [Septoria linicola]USW58640.1 hypothetical protein Slin15195_G119590 [Septoria linicola]
MSGDEADRRNRPMELTIGKNWNELNQAEKQDAVDHINSKAVAKEELVTPMTATAWQAEEEFRGSADKKKHDCAFDSPAPIKETREVEKSDMAKRREVVAERLTPGKAGSRSSAQDGACADETRSQISTEP